MPCWIPLSASGPCLWGLSTRTRDSLIASWCIMKRGSDGHRAIIEQEGGTRGPVRSNLVTFFKLAPSPGSIAADTAARGLRVGEFRTFAYGCRRGPPHRTLGDDVSGMVPADLDALAFISGDAEGLPLFRS
jgi:hypothetical protein